MKESKKTLSAGLYLVATPIGAAQDITLRALDVIRAADVIAAEDTRITRKLMSIHGIPLGARKLISYNDHNAGRQRPKILALLQGGKSVCLLADAGSPMIADPGLRIVQEAASAGMPVVTVPGPSAVIAALQVAGLPTDRFLFSGFLPAQDAKRRRTLDEIACVPATLVLFESARRLPKTLSEIARSLGRERRVAVCRELTKKYEEVWRGTAFELAERAASAEQKGEVVILVDRAEAATAAKEDIEPDLAAALRTNTLKDAVTAVAEAHGVPRREVYRQALSIGRRHRSG